MLRFCPKLRKDELISQEYSRTTAVKNVIHHEKHGFNDVIFLIKTCTNDATQKGGDATFKPPFFFFLLNILGL